LFFLFFQAEKPTKMENNINNNNNNNNAIPSSNTSEYQPNKEWEESISNNKLEKIKQLFDSMDKQNQEVSFFFYSSTIFKFFVFHFPSYF